MFPNKYIDNNLVWNKDNEVFADEVKKIFFAVIGFVDNAYRSRLDCNVSV